MDDDILKIVGGVAFYVERFFGHKVDRIIYMLTWYRFFDRCILRGLIEKIPFLSINPLKQDF